MENKRIELTPFQAPSKEKKAKKTHKAHRFVLTLGESNSKICPEYSFTDLVKSNRKNNTSSFNESDPFGDLEDDAEVAAIAQRFEAKYGAKSTKSGKKKRTKDMDDFFDLGDGYDIDDPFIDNTEAYDEVVPASLTTEHGGFYINKGKLDFKSTFEDSLEEVFSPKIRKKKKKSALDSDSEEETGESLNKKFKAMKRKKLMEKKEIEKKKKKLSNGQDGSDGSDVVLKKKKKKNLNKLKLKKLSQEAKAPVSPAPPSASLAPATPTSTAVRTDSPVPGTSVVAAAAVKAPATSTVNGTGGKAESPDDKAKVEPQALAKGSNIVSEASPSGLSDTKEDSSSRSGAEDRGDNSQVPKTTVLPSQLPAQLLVAIDSIKKEAKERNKGKCKFFSDNVNKLLLDIELGSRNLPSGSRTAIYNHLGEHLPCGKQAIQRRAKKLRDGQLEDQIKVPMQRLREAVLKVMPGLQEQHEADVAKAKLEAKDDGAASAEACKEEGSTESEGEEKVDQKKKVTRGPRRKFQWTQQIRQLLLNVVTKKMNLYQSCKSRNETAEDYLRMYLDTEVKHIWPQGWMQTRMLFKQSKSAHGEFTRGSRVRKVSTSQSKPASPAPEVSTASCPAPSSSTSSAMPTVRADSPRPRISKTEEVIEISSVLDSSSDFVSDVVVNLADSDTKPLILPPSSSSSSSAASLSGPGPAHSGRLNPSSTSVNLASGVGMKYEPTLSAKAGESGGVKRINPLPVSEPLGSPPVGIIKGMPQPPVSTPKSSWLARSSQASSLSPSQLGSGRSSLLPVYDDLVSAATTKASPSAPQRPAAFPHTQHQKSSSLPFAGHNHTKVSTLQQKSTSPSSSPSSQPIKAAGINPSHRPSSSPSQKAAVSAPPVRAPHVSGSQDRVIDLPPWAPSSKGISPVVAINRISTTMSSKLALGGVAKSSVLPSPPLIARTKSSSLSSPSSFGDKPQGQNKKTFTGVEPAQQSMFKPGAQAGKPSLGQSHLKSPGHHLAGTSLSLLNNGNSSAINMQKATVLGTSVQELIHKQQQQQQQQVRSSPTRLTVRTGADSPSMVKPSGAGTSPGFMKNPSPPTTRGSGGSVRIPQHSRSPSLSTSVSHTPALHLGGRHTASPSPPQKSPASPSSAALTLFEQMQSQVQLQEDMEGRALENLARALMGVSRPGQKPGSSPSTPMSNSPASSAHWGHVGGAALQGKLTTPVLTDATHETFSQVSLSSPLPSAGRSSREAVSVGHVGRSSGERGSHRSSQQGKPLPPTYSGSSVKSSDPDRPLKTMSSASRVKPAVDFRSSVMGQPVDPAKTLHTDVSMPQPSKQMSDKVYPSPRLSHPPHKNIFQAFQGSSLEKSHLDPQEAHISATIPSSAAFPHQAVSGTKAAFSHSQQAKATALARTHPGQDQQLCYQNRFVVPAQTGDRLGPSDRSQGGANTTTRISGPMKGGPQTPSQKP